jgi:hypothetical protein
MHRHFDDKLYGHDAGPFLEISSTISIFSGDFITFILTKLVSLADSFISLLKQRNSSFLQKMNNYFKKHMKKGAPHGPSRALGPSRPNRPEREPMRPPISPGPERQTTTASASGFRTIALESNPDSTRSSSSHITEPLEIGLPASPPIRCSFLLC